MRGNLFVVSAPSGGGKTSLTRALLPKLAACNHAAVISVSYTTREPRPGEIAGVHYHFVSRAEFLAVAQRGDFLEHAEVFGRHYGTGREKTEALLAAGQDVILDIDWQGGRQVRQHYSEALGIFILPPSAEELERRLRGRGQDGEEVIRKRMAQARDEMSHYDEYEYLIVNAEFELALEQMATIFRAARLRRPLQLAAQPSLITALLAK